MAARPLVSVVMPCLNEEAFIEVCLRSVMAQDYPRDRVEILVADGMSGDRTREVLARLSAEDPRVRMIDNPARIQAAGLNAAVAAARGEVIVRMDAHCEYRADYLRRCVETLQRTGADNVGGAQRAKARTLFQRALCAALNSPLGVGGAKYRSAENEGFVDTVFLGAFRRRVFQTIGMYDPEAVTNEDAELNQRLLAAGGKIYLSRDVVAFYYPRAGFRSLAKQYFRYGTGRARTLLKHGALTSVRPAIPFLLITAAAALLATAPLDPVTVLAFASYALASAEEALRVGRRAGLAAVPLVWAIFPVLHVCHGVGFAAGLMRYSIEHDWGHAGAAPHALSGAAPAASVARGVPPRGRSTTSG